MYSLKNEFEEMFFGDLNPKIVAKKKLNEYYDRYGENRWNIENQIPDDEYWDYFFVSGYADEVLKERAEARTAERQESLVQRDNEEIEEEEEEEQGSLPSKPKPSQLSPEEQERIRKLLEKEWKERAAQEKEQRRLFETDRAIIHPGDPLHLAIKAGKYKNTDKFNRLINSVFLEEGGYEDNLQKIDQETNMGIIQSALNRFNKAHPEFKIDKRLKDLTKNDAKLIYNLDYYNHYRIEEINNDNVAKLILHLYVNGIPGDVGKLIQQSIIDTGEYVKIDGLVGSDTIKAINKMENEGKSDLFRKILSKNRVNFEKKLKNSHKYPGRKNRFERLGQ